MSRVHPFRSIREFVAALRRDPGMPYAECAFRPATRVRYQDAD
jgi:hypothetical protein